MRNHQRTTGTLKIFVSSRLAIGFSDELKCTTSELLPDRETARELIRDMGFEPRGFEDIGATSLPVEKAYLEELRTSDIAVFLVHQTLGEGVLKEFKEADRLEIPRLVFTKQLLWGEERTEDCKNFIEGHLKTNVSCVTVGEYRSLIELKEKLKHSLVSFLTKSIRESIFKVSSPYNLYMASAEICRDAQKTLHLAKRTSPLFFHSRYHSTDDVFMAEQELKTQLEKWVEKIKARKNAKMFLLCSLDKVKDDFKSADAQQREDILKHLQELCYLEIDHPMDFCLGWTESSEREMIITSAGDSKYGILIRNPSNGNNIAMLCGSNKEIAKAVASYIEGTIENSGISTGDVIKILKNV
jgi:hypothetical protein